MKADELKQVNDLKSNPFCKKCFSDTKINSDKIGKIIGKGPAQKSERLPKALEIVSNPDFKENK